MAFRSGDSGGDSAGDAARCPAAEAEGWTEVRPDEGCARWSAPSGGRPLAPSFSGSRFWALEGVNSDGDDDEQWAPLGRQQDSDLHRQALCRLRLVYAESRTPSSAPSAVA
ncbi:uncharacterized protein LOC119316658 isoform X1 [Triticum dicoccoides]|uniref:uncharacterized protein LOC119316658 isoform X1 n=1 Tax=Triticum dicoccoides TaxID=85692 RepID=UPI001890E5EF|nr:uncharacterized protein LOC119316658 isoform X1 [Triticum dicoccoides]